MKAMRRILALLLAMTMLLAVTACGTDTPAESAPAKATTTTAPDVSEETPEDSAPTDSTTSTTVTTTTRYTKNIQGGIGYEADNNNDEPAVEPKNPIRILSIGHSFSKDAMEKYLWDLLKGAGYDYIEIAYLFFPGCSLDRHWDHITSRQGVDSEGRTYEYQQYRKTDPYTGAWQTMSKPEGVKNLATYAIKDEKWDIITLQPSPDYGAGPEVCGANNNDYDHLMDIIGWINSNKTNGNAKLMYHMTWAFAEDCKLWSFTYSDYNQLQMYNDFVNATKKHVVSTGKFSKIIPAGTAVQNARTSRLGDTFNEPGGWAIENVKEKDGYHLNDKGDYLAALTWYATITGKSAKTAWCPDKYKADFDVLAEAVDNALTTWDGVTESSYK